MEGTKIYCDVSFDEKDIAKCKGAKWDAKNKCWYFIDCINETDEYLHGYKIKKMQECLICYENRFMEKIHDEHYCCKDCLSKIDKCPLCRVKKEQTKKENPKNDNYVLLYVSYDYKNRAKSLGAIWDADKKQWKVKNDNKNFKLIVERWGGRKKICEDCY
jgi:hypothetical protein